MSVYFLSDLHLGAPYYPDSRDAEKRVVTFLEHIRKDAEAVYLLGDILDYWYEYRYVVPRGFVRFFGKLAEMSDSGIRIVWLKGNHDIWIYDYLPKELGIEVIDGSVIETIYGKKYFLTHGDGVGKMKASFRLIRTLFRNKLCQRAFSAIHPRWTVPFAYKWSRHSRKQGENHAVSNDFLLKNLRRFSLEYHALHPEIDCFVYGHVHVLCREKVSDDCEMIVLGEWIRTFSYAVLDRNGLKLLKWD